ncbi:MAG: hypothetical protein M1820_007969 [Bogoriella megaspora]|nr:MAG: hypothetical protein M1820_007969 [Bogoriella megaspora]
MSPDCRIPFPEHLSLDDEADRGPGIPAETLMPGQTTKHQSQVSISSFSQPGLDYPAVFASTNRDDKLQPNQPKNLSLLQPSQPSDLQAFFREELDVERVDKLDPFLWLAGQKRQCRPLHQQQIAGRRVVLVETCHLHLMWIDTRLFIKPCPDFLLQQDVWRDYLTKDPVIYDSALGLLRSYMALVRRKSDLKIAHDNGVLSRSVTWSHWAKISRAVLGMSNDNEGRWWPTHNKRYQYGELRLGRINWIHRLYFWGPSPRESGQLQRGFFHDYHDYGSFFQRNIVWLTPTTIYIVLVLTAMQVGLGTDRLKDDKIFNAVSFGFTVFAIIAPFGIITLLVATLAFKFIDNLLYTLQRNTRERNNRVKDVEKNGT